MENDRTHQNISVSVIIPVYNTGIYLEEAIGSITAQSLGNIEIITIDDGSTDNSPEILQKLRDKDDRIKIYTQSNQGPSEARNYGIKEASGDYILFLDSDDMLQNDTIDKCYKQCINNDLDFCTFDAESFIDGDLSSPPILTYDRSKCLLPNHLYSGIEAFKLLIDYEVYTPSPCLLMIKRKFLLSNNLFFLKGIIHEDQLFTTTLYLRANRIIYYPHILYKRRLRCNSIMTSVFSWRNVSSYLKVTDEIKEIQITTDKSVSNTIDLYLTQMLNAVAYNAHVLPIKERIKLFKVLTSGIYRKYISNRSRVILLFKKHLKPQ